MHATTASLFTKTKFIIPSKNTLNQNHFSEKLTYYQDVKISPFLALYKFIRLMTYFIVFFLIQDLGSKEF